MSLPTVIADTDAAGEFEVQRMQARRLEELHRRLHEINLFKDGPIHGLIYVCVVVAGFSLMMFLWMFPFGLSS